MLLAAVVTSRPHWRDVEIEVLILTDPEQVLSTQCSVLSAQCSVLLILIFNRSSTNDAKRDLGAG